MRLALALVGHFIHSYPFNFLVAVPPDNIELPDMYDAIDNLENEPIDLNLKTIPPCILESESQLR